MVFMIGVNTTTAHPCLSITSSHSLASACLPLLVTPWASIFALPVNVVTVAPRSCSLKRVKDLAGSHTWLVLLVTSYLLDEN